MKLYRRLFNIGGKPVSIATMIRGMSSFNEITREVAAEHGVPLIDIARRVPPTLKNFADSCHYTKSGNERISKLLFKWIVNSGLLDSKSAQAADSTTALCQR